ncbi:MAG: DUF2889 domain-containing protein [Candidatus Binatia bacterium]|nr:DUF2889 domain-containing protein [Candidatus Binatia bacterium]
MRDLLPVDPDLELIHTRKYETQVYLVSDAELLARGAVRDTKPPGLYIEGDPEELDIHEMHVELRVSLPDLVITNARVAFETHPAAKCPHIVEDYERLVGLSIARGFTHKVRELFGGPRGCTHTTALIQAMAPAVVQSVWSVNIRRRRLSGASEAAENDAQQQRQFAGNLNTCHVWAEDGNHVALIRKGERPPVPLQLTERLVQLGRDPTKWGGRK